MWVLSLCVATVALLYYVRWVYKWRNPKYNGVLPPGSMGLPLIGETLELLIPSYSLDLHPFIRKRAQRYGPIFRTHLAGRPLIVSVDPDFNNHILQQEGRLVEMWYFDIFAKLFAMEGESRMTRVGLVHKYIRRIFLNHFGSDILREKLLQQIEEMVERCLRKWSSQPCIEVKQAASAMMFDFVGKQLFSYDSGKTSDTTHERFTRFSRGFMAFPLDVPGTAYRRCLKRNERIGFRELKNMDCELDHRKLIDMLKDILRKRLNSRKTSNVDFLSQAIDSMHNQEFLTEDFIVQMMFAAIFASAESISSMLAMIIKLLSETPAVLDELRAEHARILERREGQSTALCWDEYKSMTFTMQVVNETLRLANAAPGQLRRAVRDIPVNGFMIPKGWPIIVVTTALHTNHDVFKNPLEFNPWRWKDLDSGTISKNFMPFGGGMRQCVGAEYTRAFLCAFLHVLVTKFRWAEIKIGDVYRNPILNFKDGVNVKLSEFMESYGPIFRTSIAGRPIIVSVDPEFNKHILQQEGRLVEMWYFDTYAKLFAMEGESRMTRVGLVHKYIRRIFLNHFGSDILREKLLQQIEEMVERCLRKWSSQPCIEVKQAVSAMMFDFVGKQLFSYDFGKTSETTNERFTRISRGLMAFPLNVPGTAYRSCLQEHRKMMDMLKDILRERLNSRKTSNVDFLDQAIDSMHDQEFLTEDFIARMMLGGIFASSESMSTALAMIFKFLSETPAVLEELRAEHTWILEKREAQSTALCWDEYKSMTFTMQVINEILRLTNATPGLLRRAVRDIPVNGFLIPKGWPIMVVLTALHMNPDVFENPLEFNPWRWKDLDPGTISKNFMPFGGGMRQCVGAEYARAFLCAFLHVLVTKFRWAEIKIGDVYRNPALGFKDGVNIKLSESWNKKSL
ncbi:cucurbitadienol 11-hydroxylase-like [Rhodamnia argentea]|uniref:Cucurbitadienol 11-hydroxylase-like n=1 Tax=Rhodamnia argentea TaxID=178133 RepID=A0ABM3HG46_9MYRT|nr:cucurbitadienol 11-hydroxylase-like [Rhodamnia argentea]